MTDAERAAWSQTQQEYVAALAIARKAWGTDAPADVVQAAAATILIHHGKVAPANGKPATNGKAAAAPAGDVPACKKCGGAMWDNRTDKKSPRSPDFKCKDKNCDGAIWLTPPSRKPAGKSLDEVPAALEQDGDDDLPF